MYERASGFDGLETRCSEPPGPCQMAQLQRRQFVARQILGPSPAVDGYRHGQ